MNRRGSLTFGILLILIGGWFLAVQFIPALGDWVSRFFDWPFWVVGPGLLFLVAAIVSGVSGLAVPGSIISGVGLIQIDHGIVSSLGFEDSYAVDNLDQPHPPAPDALRRQMGADLLMLRDGNWWPDFPTSANAIANLYHKDRDLTVDGVIALDLFALQYLLDALGPIQVPNYEQAVSGGNLESMIMTYWQAPSQTAPGKESTEWWEHRKDFAADLTASLLVHLTDDASADQLIKAAWSLNRAIRERHLQLYVNSKPAQDLVQSIGIGGALRQDNGDYVMIVDSNVGFNKVNPNIEQTIDHEIALDKTGAATARLRLSYQHRIRRPTPACVHESYYGDSYEELMQRCYWDYVRVYLPAGSEVLEVLGADEPAQVYSENGKTVVATSFLVENGQGRQIQIVYRPKLSGEAGGYDLMLQKQAGTDAVPVRVSITLPKGTQIRSAAPEGIMRTGDTIVWQGDLAKDREIRLQWKSD